MTSNNVELLTRSHRAVNAKKRQVKAVVFDEDARREFLTGFHKRKLAKKEEGKKKAQAREKEARLEARREQRRMLAEQAVQNAAKIEEAYGAITRCVEDNEEEWTGIASSSRAGGSLEEQRDAAEQRKYSYSDEEQLATVTVVEDFDPSLVRAGVAVAASEAEERPPEWPSPKLSRGRDRDRGDSAKTKTDGGRQGSRSDPSPRRGMNGFESAAVVKKKKIRHYETKAARHAARAKQRARRTEKAERAGGKAARRKRAAGGKKYSRG